MQGTRGQTEERAQFALLVNIKWIWLPLKEDPMVVCARIASLANTKSALAAPSAVTV